VSVVVERREGVALVTIDRPDALNALDLEHAQALKDRLEELSSDREVRALVLTGAGDKAFIAGADIKYMHGLSVAEAHRWGQLGHRSAELLETMPKPTIAAVNGVALGGGCEMALACDLRLAAQGARLGQPEINLGIVPGWGGTQRLARVTSLGYAKELILTGRVVDAEEALARGLVNAVYPREELAGKALELAASLAAKSRHALAAAKRATNLALSGEHPANLAAEASIFAELFESEDQREGMAAFIEKRPPNFSS
jgi:enoyl-CoA hydratase/carnithine racemase